jgi:hypothetical protein
MWRDRGAMTAYLSLLALLGACASLAYLWMTGDSTLTAADVVAGTVALMCIVLFVYADALVIVIANYCQRRRLHKG